MKRRFVHILIMLAVILPFSIIQGEAPVLGADTIKYACSAQIYGALEMNRIDAFTKRTGIAIDVLVCSSTSAVNSVMNGSSDIAATARRLYPRHKEYGFWETVFSKDPMAVIVNAENPISNLSEEDLKDIFGGNMIRWKEVGGADELILLVVPGKDTAAFKNFSREPMRRAWIDYDIMTHRSTMVVQVVERFPNAISFISGGAALHQGVKALSIDGVNPKDPNYPYFQTFSFVTKGKPSGAVKEFIDDVLSGEGKQIMIKAGMNPFSGNGE